MPSRILFGKRAVETIRRLAWMAAGGFLAGCTAVHDPVIFNHTAAPVRVIARIDGRQQQAVLPAGRGMWQGVAGHKLETLRVEGRGGPATDYDANFLNMVRANVAHSSELWVIEPLGINLKNVEEVNRPR